MTRCLVGFDIGGTKCAVILGQAQGDTIGIIERESFPTPAGPEATMLKLEATARKLLAGRAWQPAAIGISCGGPLDSRRGVVLSPPNLPGWDHVQICQRFSAAFGVQTHLQNDANACAFAEWRWGAGKGASSLAFLTFGTGMGAGLVLDGRLFSGACDLAGEVGHIRLAENGPMGYGKHGSFEGFCSGGGIVRLAQEHGLVAADAQQVFQAACEGNRVAVQVIETTARYLGQGLAVLVDILNPELIIIGSIFARQRNVLWPIAERTLRAEALAASVSACRVVPAALGEQIGDYAALSVATLPA
jgi:glucokinase